MKPTHLILCFSLLAAPLAVQAQQKPKSNVEKVPYSIDGRDYEGTLALPKAPEGEYPLVLIVHDWMGPSDYFDSIAEDMAELGYAAFVVDAYGVDVRPTNTEQAAQAAGALRQGDRKEFRKRLTGALDVAREQPHTDDSKVAIMGYCFGGSAALELARTGADIDAAISFHGGLAGAEPGSAKRIKAKVLILHGTDDPFAPWSEVTDLVKELDEAGVDFHVVAYGGAHHSFTQPDANMPGQAEYEPKAAERSWKHMKTFLKEVFGKQ